MNCWRCRMERLTRWIDDGEKRQAIVFYFEEMEEKS